LGLNLAFARNSYTDIGFAKLVSVWILLAVSLSGFMAQLIGGTIGMAFGITSSTGLLILGFSPAVASSAVHFVEVGTSLLNGTFHARARNVDWRVVLTIGVPGAVGAFSGAVLLSNLNLSFSKPWTAGLLLILGIVILWRFIQPQLALAGGRAHVGWLAPLGLGAGFIDATAGGGWGIITTSSLMASNKLEPSRAVGTTSTARFLTAVAGSLGFLLALGSEGIAWDVVLAMLVGCLVAAPIAARLVRVVPRRGLGLATGVAVVVLNVRQIAASVGAELHTVLLLMGGALVVALIPVVWFVVRQRREERLGQRQEESRSQHS